MVWDWTGLGAWLGMGWAIMQQWVRGVGEGDVMSLTQGEVVEQHGGSWGPG